METPGVDWRPSRMEGAASGVWPHVTALSSFRGKFFSGSLLVTCGKKSKKSCPSNLSSVAIGPFYALKKKPPNDRIWKIRGSILGISWLGCFITIWKKQHPRVVGKSFIWRCKMTYCGRVGDFSRPFCSCMKSFKITVFLFRKKHHPLVFFWVQNLSRMRNIKLSLREGRKVPTAPQPKPWIRRDQHLRCLMKEIPPKPIGSMGMAYLYIPTFTIKIRNSQ